MKCPICQIRMEHCEDADYKSNGEWVVLNWYECDKCNVGIIAKQIDVIQKLWIFNPETDDGDFEGCPFDEVIKREIKR